MDNYQAKKYSPAKSAKNNEKEQRQGLDFLRWTEEIMAELSQRSREIVRKRFGLAAGKNETLGEIGKNYNITRERVRQIILEAVKHISSRLEEENFKKIEDEIISLINRYGSIIKESDIEKKFNLSGPKEVNAVKFFSYCSGNIFAVKEKGILEKAWTVSKETIAKAKKIIAETEKILENKKNPLMDKEILENLIQIFPDSSESQVINFLEVSSRVKKNTFRKWGIANWAEINPKGTREKVYLILKEQKKPLHFTEIAQLIDRHKLGKRKAHPQTVHNELIKDERFVLIGRGIYALKEWGYFEGTIKEILKKILKESQKPLSKNEIIEKVLELRQVKETTIMINLNNAKIFQRQKDFYKMKK